MGRKGRLIHCDKCNFDISSFFFKKHQGACDGIGPHWATVAERKKIRAERGKWRISAFHIKRRIEDLAKWKAGLIRIGSRRAKSLLIFEFGEACGECGWNRVNPFSHTVPIEIEHINGDCYDSTYSNVKLLCPCCHSLTATFRGLNARKGRGRRQYKLVSQWAKENHLKGVYSERGFEA